jgi:hypothetical protein
MKLLVLLLAFSPLTLAQGTPAAPAKQAAAQSIELWGTVLQVLPEGVLVRPTTNPNTFFLVGHPDLEQLVDGAEVLVHAYQDGRYQYTDTAGVVRTVSRYRFKEKSKSAYQSR